MTSPTGPAAFEAQKIARQLLNEVRQSSAQNALDVLTTALTTAFAHGAAQQAELRKALESAKAALGDNAESQALGGKGISGGYC